MGSTPQRIFKYVPPERIDIIEKLRIRFTPPSCFNDPFEARFCVDGLHDDQVMRDCVELAVRRDYRAYVLHQRSAGSQPLTLEAVRRHEAERSRTAIEHLKRNPRSVKERLDGRAQKFWDTIGILSLTAIENSLLMWAHYSNSHEGMLIEFNAAHPFFRPSTSLAENHPETLVRVDYSARRPRHLIGETVPLSHFTVKSVEWAYEQEWRVFQLLEQSDYKEVVGNQTIHLFNLPAKAIKRLVCGCRMTGENRKRLFDAAAKNPHLRHISVLEATPDIETFGLQYRRLASLQPGA